MRKLRIRTLIYELKRHACSIMKNVMERGIHLLKSDHIPAVAKIIAIADVYDAMTSARVYRGALCPFEVIDTMYKDAFTKFEPEYILPFLKNVASSYINNDVRLSDGRIGKVFLLMRMHSVCQLSSVKMSL